MRLAMQGSMHPVQVAARPQALRALEVLLALQARVMRAREVQKRVRESKPSLICPWRRASPPGGSQSSLAPSPTDPKESSARKLSALRSKTARGSTIPTKRTE